MVIASFLFNTFCLPLPGRSALEFRTMQALWWGNKVRNRLLKICKNPAICHCQNFSSSRVFHDIISECKTHLNEGPSLHFYPWFLSRSVTLVYFFKTGGLKVLRLGLPTESTLSLSAVLSFFFYTLVNLKFLSHLPLPPIRSVFRPVRLTQHHHANLSVRFAAITSPQMDPWQVKRRERERERDYPVTSWTMVTWTACATARRD